MTKRQARIKAAFKGFFDERPNNVEWDWDKNGSPRVLVDSVFDIDELVRHIDAVVEESK